MPQRSNIYQVKTRYFLFFTIYLILLTAQLSAQQVHTYVDKDSVMVGDRILFSIVLEGDYNVDAIPDESAFEDEFNLISRQRFQITPSRDSLAFDLQFFGTENIMIGRKEIRLSTELGDTTLYSAPVPLSFKTVLAEDEEEFRPFKPIFDFARNWFPLLLLLFLLTILSYYLYKWIKNRDIEDKSTTEVLPPPEPFVNPLQILKDSIAGLEETSALKSMRDYEQFYIQLGDSIRIYLKRVYEFPALEMTTREIIEQLHKELAPSEIIKITRSVLNEADMVKFANFNPGQQMAESVLNKAYHFIDTAAVVNSEKIRYMKYKYEEKHGLNTASSKNRVE